MPLRVASSKKMFSAFAQLTGKVTTTAGQFYIAPDPKAWMVTRAITIFCADCSKMALET